MSEVAGARTLALFGATLFAAAIAFDSPSLYIAGAGLVLLGSATRIWLAGARRGARVDRVDPPSATVEGEPFSLRYRVRSGLLPSSYGIDDPLLDAPLAIRALRPRSWVSAEGYGRLDRRGLHEAGPAGLTLGDGIGVASTRVEGDSGCKVLVLPRVEPVLGPGGEEGPSAADLRRGAGEATEAGGRRASADAEVDGIKPYEVGSPASRIYWPSVARGEEIQERRLTSAGGAAPLVVLDAAGEYEPQDLEHAVRAAASLSVYLARDGGCELVVPGRRRRLAIDPGLSAWPRAHALLALVRAGTGAIGARSLPRDSPLFWVSAAGGPAPPRGWLIAPLDGRAGEPAFVVAGCGGYAVGSAGRRGRAARAAA